jgi:hypothetical protein
MLMCSCINVLVYVCGGWSQGLVVIYYREGLHAGAPVVLGNSDTLQVPGWGFESHNMLAD